MKDKANKIGRLALGLVAGTAAFLSFAGEAQAQFTGPGVYRIYIGDTNQVLDVDSTWGNGGRIGQPLLRWGSNDGANQKFVVLADGDGYVIRPLHSLQCLDVPGFQTAVGTQIVQYTCGAAGVAGGVNERFRIALNDRLTFIRVPFANKILYAPREGGRVELAEPSPAILRLGMLFRFEKI